MNDRDDPAARAGRLLAFPLLRNGLDFLASAVELLQGEPAERELKYAVLHAVAGAEVLLKARLDQEDWRLVFQHIDKANELAYQRGAFVSVGMRDLPERLAEHCGVELDAEFRKVLGVVGATRNRLQHFGLADSAEAIIAETGRLISFLFDFVEQELMSESPEPEISELQRIRDGLAGIDAVVRARWEIIEEQVDSHESLALTCPACLETAWLSEPVARCLFCGFTRDGDAAAVEWAVRVLGAGDYEAAAGADQWPVFLCPACAREALVADVQWRDHEGEPPGWGCFACGMSWERGDLVQCECCGRPTLHEQFAGRVACGTCRAWLVEHHGEEPL